MENHLVGKADIYELRNDLNKLRSDMKDIEYRLTIDIKDKFYDSKLFITGIIISAAMTILFLALKFFN